MIGARSVLSLCGYGEPFYSPAPMGDNGRE
jgi:hypothetical protein